MPKNIAFTWKVAGGDADAAFRDAAVSVKTRLVHQRLQPTAMEPRAAVASYNPGTGQLSLWVSSQNPHIHRFLCSVMLQIPEHRVRVSRAKWAADSGARFPVYADEALVGFASMDLGRPVKWTEDRSENYKATIHGRDHVEYVELCGTKDGTITGLRTEVYAGMGAYASTAGPGVPTDPARSHLPGTLHDRERGRHRSTASTPTPRRSTPIVAPGAPRRRTCSSAWWTCTRRKIKMDPVEVRRKNLIKADQFPYTTATGLSYDSGNYQGALDKALERIDYSAFRAEQAKARKEGRYLGIGVTTYCEICGLGPSQVAGAVGFGGGLYDSAIVRVYPTGVVRVYIGGKPHGQGEETTFAQIVADELAIPIENVEIVSGDTETTPQGWGTYGSRTTAVCGTAVALATRKVREKARNIAAHLLEAADADVEWKDGKFQVKGTPTRSKTFGDAALMANVAWNLPPGMEPGLEASAFFDPTNFVYPFGTHIATVEVDIETGKVKVLRYVAVDDCGPQINPVIVEGQVHGGIVQGIGEALQEVCVYDADGQLLTGTMMDYAVPRASQMPHMEVDHTVTPSPVNPLGVKGIGETGTIASGITIVNAVCDALAPLGITHLDKPLTAARVWDAVRQARGGAR